MPQPYVLLSAAVSLDGFLDDTGPERLLLSGPADFDRVDEVRAASDAILIGAGTLRTDNPRLLVNSPERRAARVAAGLPEYPLKVTVSASGDLDPTAQFWHTGGEKVVYTTDKGAERLRGLGLPAGPNGVDVVSVGPDLEWPTLLDHLADARGVRRLMVEGGGRVHTQLLQQGLADEVQLAVAPVFVGETDAPRLFGAGAYPGGPKSRLRLLETRPVGDIVLIRYAPTVPGVGPAVSPADRHWLALACELAAECPPSQTAFSVGAVVVAEDGTELARGHSREGGDPAAHAEEAALAKLGPTDPRLASATVYSSLEPCARRASRPAPCARLVLDAGVRRVVTAWREPDTFVEDAAVGNAVLSAEGAEVVVLPEYEGRAKAPNNHLVD
ncbi:dihydrofolate reductase family protein [Streptomyces europaeiscabiei]|uniref:Riboflavin biosynthesis protein RibD n=1 Tax=Streptomyces europaeiscabiei TaxID=146819 RepID=A0ABU4NX89_9ACTN|nr:dihydrofolate reductase family protein [Streptomyces europaeiscabiei]MDX2531040.1 dihydrofolate reductase family protein [Streptomyces europaeiscabiei]MDX2765019.1 dihydrofolate reductase family protein [Streptomyces europaeiscabiei]MDX2773039.1 dihydrofolate reductase family protein [Streptomyces europaeiscabiei]MDX3549455.1 dihydrofolate reductase family protein [Streptomyces europaeiscabiei]MDX3558521.1 dihydrofolate reductase family protein [Streptomyces europaeiscabiei]